MVSKERCKIPKMGDDGEDFTGMGGRVGREEESHVEGGLHVSLEASSLPAHATMVIVFSRCGGCSVDQATVGIMPSVCLDEAIGPFRF